MLLPVIFVVKVGILFLWLSSFSFVEGLSSCFFLGRGSHPCIGFFCYYPLKGWIRGEIMCEFGFVMDTLILLRRENKIPMMELQSPVK